jgi:hypothetical protein
VFGGGAEEASELAKAGLPFEIVPGVCSAIAAPAYAGIPVTHRGLTCSVSIATGHRADFVTDPGCDWSRLARGSDTLVFLMGVHNPARIVEELTALFLILERKGQDKPAGHVLKTTLLDKKYFLETGEPRPVLPPKLPVAEWATIWKYIENPVDLANLAEEETSNTMSDEEALRLMAAVASGAEVDG